MNGSSLPSDYSFFSMTHIREGWGSLKRADSIIFTKSKPKFDLLKKIEREKIFYSKSITKSNVIFPKNIIPQKLKKKKVVLLSGIGEKDWVKLMLLNPIFPFAVLKIQLKILRNKNSKKVLEKKLSLNLSHAPSKYNANKS